MTESLNENLKSNLSCSICLELFTNPLSLPCGHTFCQKCIHGHWDSLEPLRVQITCPDCRVVFPQRPEPQKNVSLHNVLEGLKELEHKNVLLLPMLAESGPKGARTVCQEHHLELTLYCLTEKRCICSKCMLKSCRSHNFEDLEEQSEKEKKKLSNDFEANGHKKENIEKELDEWEGKSQNIKGLLLLAPVGCAPIPPDVQLCETVQMDAVTRVLPEVTRLLQEELPNALHPVAAQPEILGKRSSFGITEPCCPTQTSRSFPVKLKTELNPDPTTMSSIRAQLYQDYRNLIFDPETANRYIEISHENCKATHKTSSRRNNVPESPKRFQTWQVMCMEGFLEGSHYWEVEISTFFVQIGVAYGPLKRTREIENNIGRNSHSWSLELRSMSQSVWHNNKEILLMAQMNRRIGVHLDCGAGSITFYSIKDGGLEFLHTFHSVFSEKVYPVFWLGEDVNVTLHHVQNNPEGNAAV